MTSFLSMNQVCPLESAVKITMFYEIDTLEELLTITLVGQPTIDGIVGLVEKIRSDSRYLASMNALCDLSSCDFSDASPAKMRRLILAVDSLRTESRLAILAPGDLAYGMARIYVSEAWLVNERPRRVFKQHDDAITWLESDGD